jgi:hypothetical protein
VPTPTLPPPPPPLPPPAPPPVPPRPPPPPPAQDCVAATALVTAAVAPGGACGACATAHVVTPACAAACPAGCTAALDGYLAACDPASPVSGVSAAVALAATYQSTTALAGQLMGNCSATFTAAAVAHFVSPACGAAFQAVAGVSQTLAGSYSCRFPVGASTCPADCQASLDALGAACQPQDMVAWKGLGHPDYLVATGAPASLIISSAQAWSFFVAGIAAVPSNLANGGTVAPLPLPLSAASTPATPCTLPVDGSGAFLARAPAAATPATATPSALCAALTSVVTSVAGTLACFDASLATAMILPDMSGNKNAMLLRGATPVAAVGATAGTAAGYLLFAGGGYAYAPAFSGALGTSFTLLAWVNIDATFADGFLMSLNRWSSNTPGLAAATATTPADAPANLASSAVWTLGDFYDSDAAGSQNFPRAAASPLAGAVPRLRSPCSPPSTPSARAAG